MVLYLNLKGTNAARKSTKMNCLLEYLKTKTHSFEKIEGGYLLSDDKLKYYFFGTITNNKGFVGLDSIPLGNGNGCLKKRHAHFKKIIDYYKVNYIFTEGYYNNHGSEQEKMIYLKECGITHRYFFFHKWDTLEEQMKAMDRRKECYTHRGHAIESFNKIEKKVKQIKSWNEENTITEIVSPLVENDYYVKLLFNDTFPEFSHKYPIITEINENDWE